VRGDKTFIGRISRGFEFLGYEFTPAGLDAAPPTIERLRVFFNRRTKYGR
jgi:hypothetical protein